LRLKNCRISGVRRSGRAVAAKAAMRSTAERVPVTTATFDRAAIADRSLTETPGDPTGPVPHLALTSTRSDGRADGGGEPVAEPEFSANKIAVFAKSPAQRPDLNLEVVLRDHYAWPDALSQLAFGDERSVGCE
jgi:hypothetical protein